MNKSDIIDMLSFGDMRTTGKVDEVVEAVLSYPDLVNSLVEALSHNNPHICMRAADALEKVSKTDSRLIEPYKKSLLSVLKASQQQEVQWHLAQILPRLTLTQREAVQTYVLFSRNYIHSDSSIVKTFTLQAMADLTRDLPEKKKEVEIMAREAMKLGTAALQSRARRILEK